MKRKPYLIPQETYRNEIIVQKSRFIATIAFAESVEQAKATIEAIRQEFTDAHHNVYAFKIGFDTSVIEGMSDDGEPSGTAAPPIFAILKNSELGDSVVVVTRYFGGIKLGTGGLVRAYGEAARQVIHNVKTTLKIPKTHFMLEMSYAQYEIVKRIVLKHEGEILNEDFTSSIMLDVIMPDAQLDEFTVTIRDATGGDTVPIY